MAEEALPQIVFAAYEGQTGKLKRLIKSGCDVNQASKNGFTPAFAAAENGQTVALEIFVKAGCDVNQTDNCGATPAYIAAQRGQTAALKILVEAGCDVNQASKEGATPAHMAAQEGHTAALELLVRAGCDMNQAASNGRTPAQVAAQRGLTAAVAAATLEKNDIESKRKSEKSRKKNRKNKEKKKARAAAAIEEGANVEEEVTTLLRSEQLEIPEMIAPALAPPPVHGHETADTNAGESSGGDAYPIDSSDEEVDGCRCVHCLELEEEQGETA